jgi:HEAT repeat protein
LRISPDDVLASSQRAAGITWPDYLLLRLPAVGDNAAMENEQERSTAARMKFAPIHYLARFLLTISRSRTINREILMPTGIGCVRFSAYLCSLAVGCAFTSLAMAADLSEEIEHLSKDRPRSERIEAIERFQHEYKTKGAEKAIPGLTICAKDDDPFIREESLNALTMIAFNRKLPCPDPLVNALLDPDKGVRTVATNSVGAFDEYSNESLAVAFRALEHNDYIVRSTALDVIKGAGRNDKTALEAVKKALNDKNLAVRGNAQVALWKLTGDPELKVRNLVERFAAPDPGNADSTISEEEICAVKLGKLGAPICLRDMSREEPREVAALLIKLTKETSPSMRMGAASMLGVCFGFPEGYDETESDKTKRRLTADMGVEKALQNLRDDPDETVRSSANAALVQLKEKEK